MAFNSLAYALLLAFSVAWVARGPWPALMLIVASLVFYAAAGVFDMAVFLAAVLMNWLIQVLVPADRRRIASAVAVNIGLIGWFKYRNLLLGETGLAGSYVDTTLPLGISFYSFQALAYHIDVVRRRSGQARSFPEFFLFKALFPQLIAGLTGPIMRGSARSYSRSRSISISPDTRISPSALRICWEYGFRGISPLRSWPPVSRSCGSVGTSRSRDSCATMSSFPWLT